MITQKILKEQLHYDIETGIFTWIVTRHRIKFGNIAGCDCNGYIIIKLYGTIYYAHRLAFLYVEGRFPVEIDHKNRIKNDNTWSNLEESSRPSNNKNKILQSNNTTGFAGVVKLKHNGKNWRSSIQSKVLGYFNNFEDTVEARIKANYKYDFYFDKENSNKYSWKRKVQCY